MPAPAIRPYKLAETALPVVAAVAAALIGLQFRGDLTNKEQLTLLSSRAGLVVDPARR